MGGPGSGRRKQKSDVVVSIIKRRRADRRWEYVYALAVGTNVQLANAVNCLDVEGNPAKSKSLWKKLYRSFGNTK